MRLAILVVMFATGPLAAGELAPGTPVRIEAAAGGWPRGPGWELVEKQAGRATFMRYEETRQSSAQVRSVVLPPAALPEPFLARAERHKAAEFAAYDVRSVHFNAVGNDAGACLQFDALLQPPGREGEDGTRITVQGWLCPHPADADRAVEAVFRQEATEFGFTSPDDVEAFLRDWKVQPSAVPPSAAAGAEVERPHSGLH
jgi:hypothetical protein